jgi:hypothetical protein
VKYSVMPNQIKNFILFCFSIAVSILILEVLLNTLNLKLNFVQKMTKDDLNFDKVYSDFRKYDSTLGWSLKPNYNKEGYIIDQNGFRSNIKENLYTSQKSKTLLIGDSMIFGYLFNQQDHIFSEKLNLMYPDHLFVNTGVPGWSTVQYYLALEKYILMPNVKNIILFHTVENDMWMNIRKHEWQPAVEIKNDELIFLKPNKIIMVPLYKRSMIYQTLNKKLKGRLNLNYLVNRLDLQIRGSKSYSWRVNEKVMTKINDLAKKYSVPLIIIDIPTPRMNKNRKKKYNRMEYMKNFSKKNELEYFNLIEYYPENISEIFIKNDSHWNNLGHKFISSFFKEKIIKK